MTTQFKFRLLGTSAPDGELEADQLLAIVTSLKEVATKIGRVETNAEPLGRAPQRTQRVAGLTIGMALGSTTILARRTGSPDALDIALGEEQAFDEKFADLIESIALDRRPAWVSDPVSRAAADLTHALRQAALEVEFSVAGQLRQRFQTKAVRRETWLVEPDSDPDAITFVGTLYAVNLKTHRLQVQDDVGHRVALPKVLNDADASRHIGSHVLVTGVPFRDTAGRLLHIMDSQIVPAPDPLGGARITDSLTIDDILRSAPGPDPLGGIELTDEEFDQFFEALHG